MRNSLTPAVHTIDLGATIVVAIGDAGGAVLLDTGIDAQAGKKLEKFLEFPLKAIYHTHSHADHCGSDDYLVRKLGIPSYMPAGELSFLAMPELEPAYLYGGAGFSDACNKFLCAAPCAGVLPLSGDSFTVGDTEVSIVPLGGHSPAQVGYLADGVFYVGDAVFTKTITEKYKVLYIYDPARYAESLDTIRNIHFDTIVLCHKGIFTRDEALVLLDENREHLDMMRSLVLERADGRNAEQIASDIMQHLGVHADTTLFLLISSTVKGYLRWLERDGLVSQHLEDSIRWIRI